MRRILALAFIFAWSMPALAVITLVQVKPGDTGSSTASLTITLDTAATAGDLLVSWAFCNGGAGWTAFATPTGFSNAATFNGAWSNTKIASKVATGGETSIIWAATGAGGSCEGYTMMGAVLQFHFSAGAPAYDVASTAKDCGNVATCAMNTTPTLASASSVCVGPFVMYEPNQNTTGPTVSNSWVLNPTGFMTASPASNARALNAYRITTATTAQTTTASWTNNAVDTQGIIQCFKETAAPTGSFVGALQRRRR